MSLIRQTNCLYNNGRPPTYLPRNHPKSLLSQRPLVRAISAESARRGQEGWVGQQTDCTSPGVAGTVRLKDSSCAR